MGKRGPPPKPSALKRMQGTHRPDRAARNEVVAPPGAPVMPDMPKAAVAKWHELVPILLERGTLSVEDGAILEEHCRAYASWQVYQASAEKAPTVKTPWGPKINPAAQEARKWAAIVTQTGDRLGVNASARSRVGAKEKPGKSEAEKQTEADVFGKPASSPPALKAVLGGKSE